MLVIPAIVIFGFYIFSVFTYQLENNERSIKEAKDLSKGAFWKIIGIFLISGLITLTVTTFYQMLIEILFPVSYSTLVSWYNPANQRFDMIFIYNLMYNIVPILFEPLFICLLTPLFIHMKARKKLGYGHQKEYNYQRVYTPPTQPEYVEKGIFCPFCGQHMDFKLKFCPSCGESIDFLTK
jgi:ribosomal protein L33